LIILSIKGFTGPGDYFVTATLPQGEPSENRRRRSLTRYSLVIAGLMIGLLFSLDGVVLLFLGQARTQSSALAISTLPRALGSERLAVDASHLTALTAELPAASSIAERQTVMQRIDGLRGALTADMDMLRQAGLTAEDDAALIKTEEALIDGAAAMNGVAQSGIDLHDELSRQRDRARAGCESNSASRDCQEILWALAGSGADVPSRDDQPALKAVAVLRRDLAINEQRRINLLRRQSELASRFLALASAQSELAADEIRVQQDSIVWWVTRIEWVLGVALMATFAASAGLWMARPKRAPED
jgi:hypothetical protein